MKDREDDPKKDPERKKNDVKVDPITGQPSNAPNAVTYRPRKVNQPDEKPDDRANDKPGNNPKR